MFPCGVLNVVKSFDWELQHAVRNNQTALRQWDETPRTLLELPSAASSRNLLAQCMEAAHTADSVHTFRVCHFGFHQAVHVLGDRYRFWTNASHSESCLCGWMFCALSSSSVSALPACRNHLKLKLLWNKSWGICLLWHFSHLGYVKLKWKFISW